jgi:hypothetical protein
VIVKFICGCRHETTSKDVMTDYEGFMVCAQHGQRRYGWLSLPNRDFSASSLSPLERERLFLDAL